MSDRATNPTGEVWVTFDLTPEEWVEVAWEHNRRSPLFAKMLRDVRVALASAVGLLGLLMWLLGAGYLSVVCLVVGVIGVVAAPALLERTHRRQYRVFARDGIAHGMFGTHTVRLLDEGLLDETDSYRRLTRWHAIDRVEGGAGAFLVYMGRNAFLPIPHSAFRDPGALRGFSDRFFDRMAAGSGVVRHRRDDPDAALAG